MIKFNSVRNILHLLPQYDIQVPAISDKVIENTDRIISVLSPKYNKNLDVNNFTATAHNTISIDWVHRKDFLTLEIGAEKAAIFYDISDDLANNDWIGKIEDVQAILVYHLNRLYGNK